MEFFKEQMVSLKGKAVEQTEVCGLNVGNTHVLFIPAA